MDLADVLAEPYRDYWQALGQFIDQFASVEHHMQMMLRYYANTSDEVGRAVFSGHRIKDGIDTVNRLFDARKLPRPKSRLAPVFHQLGQINDTRNNLVHWGGKIDWAGRKGFIVSNKHLVQVGRTELQYLVTLGDFRAMTADLLKIGVHFQVEMYRAEIERIVYRRSLREVLTAAWSYKPPQRAAQPQRPPREPRKSRPQRPTSEE